jgi:hypothetical protein
MRLEPLSVASGRWVVELGAGWLPPELECERREWRGDSNLTGAVGIEPRRGASRRWVVGLEVGRLVLELEREGRACWVSLPFQELGELEPRHVAGGLCTWRLASLCRRPGERGGSGGEDVPLRGGEARAPARGQWIAELEARRPVLEFE